MFPVVVLALLCGLLAQNAQGYANPQATVHLSPEMFQQMISERMDRRAIINRLQSLPLHETLKNSIKQSGGIGFLGNVPFIGDAISNFYGDILGVKIRNVELLNLDTRFDAVEKRIFLTVPADLEVGINLPLSMGSLLRMKLSVDVQVGIQIFNDPTDDRMRLVLGNCQNKPGHVIITLLDNKAPLLIPVNELLGIVTNVFETTLPNILQKELCPLVNALVKTVLDLLQGSWSSQVQGETIQLSPSTYKISENALEIGYQAGSENYVIPPVSTRLPDVPLSAGSSMNMLLSKQFLSSIVQAALPPGTIKIDNRVEIDYFNQKMATVPEFSMPADARIESLTVSYGIPALSLTTGLFELYQDMELKAFGNHRRGSNVNLFTIKMKAVLDGEVSTDDLILRLTLRLQGLHGVALVKSFVGTFDPLYLRAAMSSVLSNTFVPHVNSLLSGGCPLSMMQELGVEEVDVSIGKNVLLLTARRQ